MRRTRALEQLVEPEARRALALGREPRAERGQAPRVLGRAASARRRGRPPRSSWRPRARRARAAPGASEDRPASGEASSPSSASSSRGLASAASRWHRSRICWRPHQPRPPRGQRRQPGQLQRALVEAHLGRRAQQHDDVAGATPSSCTSSATRWATSRASACLTGLAAGSPTPSAPGASPFQASASVTSSSTTRRGRGRVVAPGAQVDPVLVQRAEGAVERAQDLRARAEVGGQRRRSGPRASRRAAARAEDLDVGVAEAVDRLELVADRAALSRSTSSSSSSCSGVRVLELVDHDALEALAVAGGDARLAGEQVAREQLEVVEVDARRGRAWPPRRRRRSAPAARRRARARGTARRSASARA